MPTTAPTLAEITKRVDHLISRYEAAILHFVNKLTAESPYIAALFDGADAKGLEIYRGLGFQVEVDPKGLTVLDILQHAINGALCDNECELLDELPGYQPGTVLLYVFTMGAVVARRFEQGNGALTKLREVRRMREVELRTGLRLEGVALVEAIVQRSSTVLLKLRDRSSDWVGLIARSGYGAKVGFIERESAIGAVEAEGARGPAESRDWARRVVNDLAAGKPDLYACLVEGWGPMQVVWIAEREMPVGGRRYLEAAGEDLLHEWIMACGDQKRALGLLEKCLDKLGEASPASASLADLVGLVRHSWQDCSSIDEQIRVVLRAGDPIAMSSAGLRLHRTLMALEQATAERRRGGALNTGGGSA